MKRKLFFLLWIFIPLFCLAQDPLPREFFYDNAGNRVLRKVIDLGPPFFAPPPQDTTHNTESTSLITNENNSLTSLTSLTPPPSEPLPPQYFIETIAQTQIKVYPNPSTEKITLEIIGWETLQNGIFKLYSLNGQLLQEQPVSSATTTVSLSTLSKGVYILKVQINNHTEEWKIMKQ